MKAFLLLLLSSTLYFSAAQGAPNNLDELLNQVKKDRLSQRSDLKKREADFRQRKNTQKKLLADAKKELARQEAITKKLTASFEKNEKQLSTLEDKLKVASGVLGEMFGVVKQVAGDFKGQFQNSIISAQFPNRDDWMANLAERKELPDIHELEQLWISIQKEMTESGKVVRFKSQVVLPSGEKSEQQVMRIGSFNLISGGKYLSYQSSTNQLIELPRQPQGKFLSMISDLESANGSVEPFGLDPSRGSILSMLVQAPSLSERVQQGGLVGYVVLTLLFLGICLVIERMITLSNEGAKIKKQLASDVPNEDNTLGRLMKVYNENKDSDIETLELKMDEAIVKSLPKFEKWITTIKVMFSVAPLLGLLGTVTGMISTFQSITLFGTGDPKLMAGGISTALVTTVLGLVCSIPLLLLHNLVSSKSKGLIQIIEEQSVGFLALKAEKK